MKELTQARLHELFDLNTETGDLIRRVDKGPAKAGSIAGGINSEGYRQIKIDGRLYKAHRLIWCYIHGNFPTNQLDHRNGVRTDNRIENLRECTNAENCQNQKPRTGGASKFPGVSWHTPTQKWIAQIGIQGKRKHLGLFENEIDGAEAYRLAKQLYHTFQPTPHTA